MLCYGINKNQIPPPFMTGGIVLIQVQGKNLYREEEVDRRHMLLDVESYVIRAGTFLRDIAEKFIIYLTCS